jgi:putative protein-disulfide isomerase
MAKQEEKIIYHFDPLCGWCFAFQPTMRSVREAYPELPIALRYGGLVVGERVAPIANSRDYLINGLADVQQRAGVAAGPAFYEGLLAEGSYVSNSEPPCRAILVMQQLAPERAYDFAAALPDIFYVHGRPLDDPDVLAELAAAQGVDPAEFLRRWQSAEAREELQRAFAATRASGLTTYPTLLYQNGGTLTLITQGYMQPGAAVERIARLRQARSEVIGHR